MGGNRYLWVYRLRRRAGSVLAVGAAAGEWLRHPQASLAAYRTVRSLGQDNAHTVQPAEYIDAARSAVRLGLRRRAMRLLELSDTTQVPSAELLRLRRQLPGYTGRVSPALVARASQVMLAKTRPSAAERDIEPLQVLAEPIASGRGVDVEAVVRHTLSGGGGSMIRKTLRGVLPREILTYRSGLMTGGDSWRTPAVYALESDGTARWHLFIEDLGRIARPEGVPALGRACRALGEFNRTGLANAALLEQHPWLERPQGPLGRFGQLLPAIGQVADLLGSEAGQRLQTTLERLSAAERELHQRYLALPQTLCHGDATRANIAWKDGKLVLFDLTACWAGPIGSDLGDLLGPPNRAIRETSWHFGGFLDAYLEGLDPAGDPMLRAQAAFGTRYRLVSKSLRWQLRDLPQAAGRRQRERLADAHATLMWLCDEAAVLLEAPMIPGNALNDQGTRLSHSVVANLAATSSLAAASSSSETPASTAP